MILIKTKQETLLKPLQMVTGIVENRTTLPILSNVLIKNEDDKITFLTTDLEIQIKSTIMDTTLSDAEKFTLTVSAKKFQDILRSFPVDTEIALVKKAVEISCIGQIEVMKAMHPKMSETEIQGVHEFVFKKYGAEYEGYPSIVGAGNNGCILHYIENVKEESLASDLTHDIFIKVYMKLSSYKGNSKFSTWLFRIANNLASNSRRSKGRRKEVSMAGSESGALGPRRGQHDG